MQKIGQELVFSPTDLTTFVDSPFASWMTRFELEDRQSAVARDEPDGLMSLLAKRGIEHEIAKLEEFKKKGCTICEISTSGSARDRLEATEIALRSGADVIYQAFLVLPPFAGVADFLVKVPGNSSLGDWHYVVWDTKLSSIVKPTYLLQTCCYAEMLEELQGVLSETLTIALGSGDEESFRTLDYMSYYQAIKAEFLDAQRIFNSADQADPGKSESWGNWSDFANKLFIERDHLIQVANIRRSQIVRLNAAGIGTMQQLAELPSDAEVKGVNSLMLTRLRAQAAIQCNSRGLPKPLYSITAMSGQGLALLPPPSPMDIFFDIEGFPLEKGGLEYLWGSTYFDKGERQFIDFWAHNAEQEKQCFVDFIAWAYARWISDPSMHIYHYASYEITACRKLMGRHGVCEMEVDQLLRNEVFVDLYKIVKDSLLLGEPRYSIKNVENLYRPKRDTDVANGGDSVVVYERWRTEFRSANPDVIANRDSWTDSNDLSNIRDYNKDDCDSTQELVDWLREQQTQNNITYSGKVVVVEAPESEELTNLIKLRDTLLAKSASDNAADSGSGNVAATLAWLLEFHRRESKPVFWRLFDRRAKNEDELFDDLDCISGCERTDFPPFKQSARDRNLTYQYQFDPSQECKGQRGGYYVHGQLDDKKVDVVSIDTALGVICIKSAKEPPPRVTLIPDEFVGPAPIPSAIESVATRFLESSGGIDAILDFLQRTAPRISGIGQGESIIPNDQETNRLGATIAAVVGMQDTCLTIQGPPGTGKTYTASHVIAQLMRDGKKVGITSNSHKAINNLLIGAAKVCKEQGIAATFVCTSNTDGQLAELDVVITDNKGLIDRVSPSTVIGTTAWGFCRQDLEKQFDYLFVDEAGQVSVANLVGMSRATGNIVLIGDQMQLGQPTQGTHPGESGMSALDYYMGTRATIPDNQGIFLGVTWRMHPEVNRFISDAIYEGRLRAAEGNKHQIIRVPNGYSGALHIEAGVIIVPVKHAGNTQGSDEEADQIANLTQELIGRTMIGKDGSEKMVGWQDILYVAPYNFQVNKLKIRLAHLSGGDEAQVGSVDKFQGQEAAIVFLSMCSSDANESARGLDFLFDERRLNVAVSRAKSLAIVVMNPSLATTRVSTPNQMKKVNVLSRLSTIH
jgi:predicted RecB family nuclease